MLDSGLVELGDANTDGGKALLSTAVQQQDLQLVRMLLEHGAKPNFEVAGRYIGNGLGMFKTRFRMCIRSFVQYIFV